MLPTVPQRCWPKKILRLMECHRDKQRCDGVRQSQRMKVVWWLDRILRVCVGGWVVRNARNTGSSQRLPVALTLMTSLLPNEWWGHGWPLSRRRVGSGALGRWILQQGDKCTSLVQFKMPSLLASIVPHVLSGQHLYRTKLAALPFLIFKLCVSFLSQFPPPGSHPSLPSNVFWVQLWNIFLYKPSLITSVQLWSFLYICLSTCVHSVCAVLVDILPDIYI